MRYPFIKQYQGQYRLCNLCRVMQVSRSGFNAWRKRSPSRRSIEEQILLALICVAYKESKETYGSPRIHRDLLAAGARCGLKRVARIMRKHNVSARAKKRFAATTDSNHGLPVAQNLLQQNFVAQQTNARWTSDITYIWTSEGWLYLAVVLDLASRRIVGWSMKSSLDRSIVLDALRNALLDRRPGPGLICHSDRGSQYASDDYQQLIIGAQAICSMSGKGNCYDNAPTESLFASLKRELVYRTTFATRGDARAAIFHWIAVWYNRKRRHSSLGYTSPEEFEQQLRRKAA